MNATAYRAPRWARNAHLQTLWGPLRRRPQCTRRRERLELPDGDFLDLDWLDVDARDVDTTPPLVLLVHGLGGSSDSVYIAGLQPVLAQQGIGSVALNLRGATGPNRLARCYHGGDSGDLRVVLQQLAQRFPQRALGAAGFSLGGSMLLNLLAEDGAAVPLAAACAVSVPFLLGSCSARLDQGFSRTYRDHLLKGLLASFAAKRAHFAATGNDTARAQLDALGGFAGIRTFRDYDQRLIAPLHGFAGADDYYQRASCRQRLAHITVPTLLLQALDDPFMTPAVLPQAAELSPSTQLEASAHGGHVCFVQGSPWRTRYWLEERVPAWFAGTLASRAAAACTDAAMISSGPGSPGVR